MTEHDDWQLEWTPPRYQLDDPRVFDLFRWSFVHALTTSLDEAIAARGMPVGFELYLPKVDPTAELHKAWESAKWSEWEDAVIYEGTPIPYPVIGYDPAASLFSETVPDYSIQTTWGGPYRNFQQAKVVPSPTLKEMMRNFRRKNADKTITRNPNCKL